MAKSLDPKELVTVEDLAISSLWAIAALVEGLEREAMTCTRTQWPECTTNSLFHA